ncbi:hypothetical protein [Luteimonas saliphila]|uniref:hypothetical protein n=1 Tax=Luteimonas saliphila TaxID=2804919 RepID=UPI00192E1E14|nr:hypothetical protein [Luteimonas saliphila]
MNELLGAIDAGSSLFFKVSEVVYGQGWRKSHELSEGLSIKQVQQIGLLPLKLNQKLAFSRRDL